MILFGTFQSEIHFDFAKLRVKKAKASSTRGLGYELMNRMNGINAYDFLRLHHRVNYHREILHLMRRSIRPAMRPIRRARYCAA